jgi:hypothetical protein
MRANCTKLVTTKLSPLCVHGVHTYSFDVSEFGNSLTLGKKVMTKTLKKSSRDVFSGVSPFGFYPSVKPLATRDKKVHYDVL